MTAASMTLPGWRSLRPVLLPLGTAVVFLVLWEVLVRTLQISAIVLPPPSAVLKLIAANYALLLQHAGPTALESTIGFLIATVVGIALGLGIAYSTPVREAFYPHLVLLQLVPKVALAPLFVAWIGLGSGSRVTTVVVMCFFPVVIATIAGLRHADAGQVRFCRGLGADRSQLFRYVLLPSALPQLVTGLKVGVTLAMVGVVVGEFITAQAGLGYLIVFGASNAETALVLAAMLLLSLIGLVQFGLVTLLGDLMLRRFGFDTSIAGDDHDA